ncbi:VOC family protein [Streptosporangium sp. NPDC001559]|uniref:VOC family protein n=1 Tax=Streptosporangium sp. NPDC001559 TaxID=3366187 RepID=UPI0036E3E3BD
MTARQSQLVVDCARPETLAVFWSRLLGGVPVHRDPAWSSLDPPGGLRMAFQRVPEAKAGKNRLHLDIAVEDVTAAAEDTLSLGGRRSGGPVRDAAGVFQVMLDPEGNEFCLVGP